MFTDEAEACFEDNVRIDPGKVGCIGINLILLSQGVVQWQALVITRQ
jgi:hypothetical protein